MIYKTLFFDGSPTLYATLLERIRNIMNLSAQLYITLTLMATLLCSPVYGIQDTNEIPMNPTALPDPDSTQGNKESLLLLLLSAEMSENRGMPENALQEYLKAARISLDPNVAKQATLLAIQLQKPEEAVESSKLWAENDPKNLQAQLVATTLLIGSFPDQAVPFIKKAIDLAPNEIVQQMIPIQLRLSDTSRKQLKNTLNKIADERSNDPYAQLLAGESSAQEEDIPNAEKRANAALKILPKLTRAIELKARLIRHQDVNETKALKYLREQVQQFPKNSELRLFFASALIDSEHHKEAMDQLSQITRDKEYGGQALVFLGELYLKNNNLAKATESLKKATEFKDMKDTAGFLLGQLAVKNGKTKEAIQWFTNIQEGSFHVPAYIEASSLLASNKEYTKAIDLLHNSNPSSWEEEKQLVLAELDILIVSNDLEGALKLADEVLPKVGDDTEILFKHSLISIKLHRLEAAEADLKKILAIDPNHSDSIKLMKTISQLKLKHQQ